ncbi:MAG: M23 family metallopeptidase, partial [Spirochaetes bacterium]|nr:M23 family metallopeptidase [Spirochaetota bacterium]
ARPVARVVSDKKGSVKPIGITIFSGKGAAVLCAENGVVKKIGYMRGFGNYIVVGHPKRYMTVYANVKKIHVKEGESVKKGGKIATLSSSFHFQINKGGKPLDALSLLPGR